MNASLQRSVMIPTQKISLIVPADPIRSIRGTKFILCRPDYKVRHYRLVNAYLCLETHEIGELIIREAIYV